MVDVEKMLARFADAIARDASANPLPELIANLSVSPVPVWTAVADRLARQSWPTAALAVLAEAEVRFGRQALIEFHRALAYRAIGDLDNAAACALAAAREAPQWLQPVRFVADGLREHGRTHAAASMLCDFAMQPEILKDVDTVCTCMKFMIECAESGLAHALGRAAMVAHPHHLPLIELLAKTALETGQFDEARNFYRDLALGPHAARARLAALGLALSKRFDNAADTDIALIDGMLQGSAPASAKASVHFARAKISDDLRDYRAAAEHLRIANAAARAVQPWDRAQWLRDKARALQGLLPRNRAPDRACVPVFVIGMPRSGTTLLSELMARHAGIVSRGELNFAEHIDRAVTGTPRQAWEDAVTSSAAMYRTHIIRDDAAARVYIDKNPMNFLHLDWITAALPEARIIYCTRHKADVALSLWFQFFESPATRFSHDFAWIREVDADCEEIVSYWSARASILRVAYEDLVLDQTAVMARVLAHIGYDADVSAAEPMVQAGQIATSSLWQARQPVYASSIGRYRHYLEFIPELKSFL